MFKNGGIILKKKSAVPSGVDRDSVIIFLNEEEKLSYVDDMGYVHLIGNDQPSQPQSPPQWDSSNIPSNYDDLMVSTNTFFGDGSDGNLELQVSIVELNRDYYFNNVKLNVGGIIKTNGFRLFVKETLTFNGGSIVNSGNPATAADVYFAGGIGGVETKVGSLGQSSAGGKGAKGTISDGQNTVLGVTSPLNNGGDGGHGGNGGDGSIGKGGKSINVKKANKCIIRNVYLALQASRGQYLINGGLGGDGGGSGGGDGTHLGAGGSGGGAGGGVIQILAKTVSITPNAAKPSILANGGDGMCGSDAQYGACGGGGGGSGGGGGYIQLFFLNMPFNLINNLINAKGGNPGAGGKGIGGGSNGTNGGIGQPGTIDCINVKTGNWNTFIESSHD